MSISQKSLQKIMANLRKKTADFPPPMSETLIREYGRDPYMILIACLLSLRSRDVVTLPVVRELFKHARTPRAMCALPEKELQAILRPIGFFRRKAHVLREVSQALLERYNGQVPADEAALLSLPGVGRKTANLVLGKAFGIPAICVDTHVHRIANHLGIVRTDTPEETERALQKIVPRDQWIELNDLFVRWGQYGCTPLSKVCRCNELAK